MTGKCRSSGSTDRTGLYVMVFLIMLNTCTLRDEFQQLQEKVEELASTESAQRLYNVQ